MDLQQLFYDNLQQKSMGFTTNLHQFTQGRN